MNELAITDSTDVEINDKSLLNPLVFAQISKMAEVMSSASLIPESLSHEGSGKDRARLPDHVVRANCFLVANQAVRWGLDPFAVAQCSSVVHGRLMFEGKLVAGVLDANLGINLVHAYGKWDSSKEACILSEDGTGDNLAIRIGEGRYDDGVAVFTGRFIDGHVGGWKTTGNNTPWRQGQYRKMLVYRGTREWARIYQPGAMLGVVTDDEYDPAWSAKDITPRNQASAGRDVIERLKAAQTKPAAGFDSDRVEADIKAATAPDSASNPDVPDTEDETQTDVEPAAAQHTEASKTTDADVGPTDQDWDWLFNVVGMLWAATTPSGDPSVLENQRKAAASAYPADGVHKDILNKAKSCVNYCKQVVTGEVEPSDALEIIGGVIHRSVEDIQKRSSGDEV